MRSPTGDFVCLIGPERRRQVDAPAGPLRGSSGRAAAAIRFDGADVGGLRPDLLFRRGIAHVPQGRSTFPQMTVRENLLMGAYSIRDRALARERLHAADGLFPIVVEQADRRAGLLSGGEQKQVEMARAIVTSPRLLLLDEPTLGLEPRASRTVMAKMRELNEQGVTILLVEQNARTGLGHGAHRLRHGARQDQAARRGPAAARRPAGQAPLPRRERRRGGADLHEPVAR